MPRTKRRVVFLHPGRADLRENKSPRLVSVEIEVAGVNSDDGVSRAVGEWGGSIVDDGSLPDDGFEINTTPAGGDIFLRQIRNICAALRNSGAEVDDSCGLHVHADARDFCVYDVRRLVRVYAIVEDALFEACDPDRRHSNYCNPCGQDLLERLDVAQYDSSTVRYNMLMTIYSDLQIWASKGPRRTHNADNIREKKQFKYAESRYRALNLHSWYHRGSIELRTSHGLVDAEEICSWGMLWAAVMDYALRASEKDVDRLQMSSSRHALLHIAASERLTQFLHQRWKRYAVEIPNTANTYPSMAVNTVPPLVRPFSFTVTTSNTIPVVNVEYALEYISRRRRG